MPTYFNKMNGYEFEEFIAALLRKIGFIVEETSLSGDGGVDLIAYSEEPLYKGKYLIQCKCWEGNIGQPTVRDLYGVVLSNNANKGIIITNSFFTEQAIKFAEGKNIELINGNILNGLMHKYLNIDSSLSIEMEYKHFTSLNEFENNKYQYLKNIVDTNQRSKEAYLDLFRFLYGYILNKNFKIMYSGLIEECLRLCDEIIKKFGKRGKSGKAIDKAFIQMKGTLLMLLGKIDMAFEILNQVKKITFNTQDFTENLVNHYFYFYPTHFSRGDHFERDGYLYQYHYKEKNEVFDTAYISYKTNLLSLLININDDYSSKWLYDRFNNYYDAIIDKLKDDTCFSNDKSLYTIIAERNYEIAINQMESLVHEKELKFFIPTDYISNQEAYSSCLKYEMNNYLNIKDITSYWSSELNVEKQIDKMRLIISLIETTNYC